MAHPIGSVWGSGTWTDGVWGDGTWGDAAVPPTPPAPPPEPKLFLRLRGDVRFIRRA